jgi:3D (Asp-Asp-Asp) domain-containing protein
VKKSFSVKAYAYTGGGTTASGKKAGVGLIAVDPKVIPLGTVLYIEGYGVCVAADTGGNIKGRTVDLYMDSEKACRNWGKRSVTCYILTK